MFKWRRTMRSTKLAQRRRKQLVSKFLIIFIAFVVVISVSSWFLNRSYLHINKIVVNGNSAVSDSDLEKITEDILSGKYFFLFPRKNTFIYPQEEVEIAILNSFKQIESIDIVRTNFQTLAIEVEEQEPYALWCFVFDEGVLEDCYFINEDGLIFSKAPNFTGDVFFKFYGDLVGTNPIGEYYFKVNNNFNRVNALVDSIKELGLTPIKLIPLRDSDLELYMNNGSKILFSITQSMSEVKDNLKVVLESETFKNEDLKNIDYIDLRFGNKVYFKLR